jgi:hypothetical protein
MSFRAENVSYPTSVEVQYVPLSISINATLIFFSLCFNGTYYYFPVHSVHQGIIYYAKIKLRNNVSSPIIMDLHEKQKKNIYLNTV